MTAEILAGVVAAILSLAFSYIPGLNTKFAEMKPEQKRLIMLVLLVATAAVAYGMACWGVLAELTGIGLTCDRAGLIGLLRVLFVAVIANQGVYSISYRTEAVREAKLASITK